MVGGKAGGGLRRSISAALLGAVALVSTGALMTMSTEAVAQSDSFTIRLTSPVPRGPAHVEAIQWWADEVEKRTDGRVNFRTFYAGSLMGALETLPATQDGRIGGGYMSPGYWPAELPLWTVDSIPFVTEDPYAAMRTFYDLSQNNEHFRSELERNGIRLMFMIPVTPATSGLREPVETLDGFDGKRLRVIGYVAQAFQEIGAEPVSIAPGEQYEAIQRGALDGFGSLVFDAIPYFKLHEVAPHLVYSGIGMYASTAVGISLDLWNSMPEDLQTILVEVAEEYMIQREPAALMDYEEAACTKLLDEGATVTTISDDEVQQWKDRIGDSILEAWYGEVQSQGISRDVAEQFYDEYVSTLRGYEAESPYELGVARCAARSN